MGSGFLPFSCCFFSVSCTFVSLFFSSGSGLTGDLEGDGGVSVGRAVAFKGWDTGNPDNVLGGESGVAAVTFEGIAGCSVLVNGSAATLGLTIFSNPLSSM